MITNQDFWIGCLFLLVLIVFVFTLLSGWLVARALFDGLLLVLLVGGEDVVKSGGYSCRVQLG
jgi:hypothetical protein